VAEVVFGRVIYWEGRPTWKEEEINEEMINMELRKTPVNSRTKPLLRLL